MPRGCGFCPVVTRPQYDGDVITWTRYTIEFAAERRESAAMPPDLDAIDPNCAVVVDRLKMKQDMLSRPIRRDLHLPAIPNSVVIIGVADAGQIRFRAEGHSDPVVEVALQQAAVDATVALVNLKLPFAIEQSHSSRTTVGAGIRRGECLTYCSPDYVPI